MPRGDDQLRQIPDDADGQGRHFDRAGDREVRRQRGGDRSAHLLVQGRRQVVPAERRMQVQARIRAGRREAELQR